MTTLACIGLCAVGLVCSAALVGCSSGRADRIQPSGGRGEEPAPRRTDQPSLPPTTPIDSGIEQDSVVPWAETATGADPDQLAIVQSLCPAAVQHEGSAVHVGCRACTFLGAPADSDGAIVADPVPFHRLVALYRGRFESPHGEQAALVFAGCRVDGGPGGTLLAEPIAKGGPWRAVRYYGRLFPDTCVTLPRAGHDVLACHRSDGGFDTVVSKLFVFDFLEAAPDRPTSGEQVLARLRFNAAAACAEIPDEGLSAGWIESLAAVDVDGNGQPDLRVTLHHGHVGPSPALRARIGALCSRSTDRDGWSPSIDPESYLKMSRVTLDFLSRPEGLVATEPTRAWLATAAKARE